MIRDKIKSLVELKKIREQLRIEKKRVVFTNGVFDILHRGHVEYLEQARRMGDVLMLGLNSDASVRKIKGPHRPIMSQDDRASVLAALESVSYLCLFDEETPENLIAELLPDVLVKGGDYQLHQIVGRDIVEAHGGVVTTIPLTPGKSTTDVIGKIVHLIKKGIIDK